MTTPPLKGLRVIEWSNNYLGASAGQLFADFGAEVIVIEPPGGSPLRLGPAYPFLGRGKKSIELDLRADPDRALFRNLALLSDVLIETFRPGVAERLGLGYDDIRGLNRSLIYASATGFGTEGPLTGVKGYEALVFAKAGGGRIFAPATPRPGPVLASVPYCSWSGAQGLTQGILAALVERESSGEGQKVETSMIKSLAVQDPFGWTSQMITDRYVDAYVPARPFTEQGEPVSPLFAFVLIGLSADGDWLQFSQVGPHLFRAFMRVLDLEWMLGDPAWKGLPALEEQWQRTKLWEMMLEAVRRKTTGEWQAIFDRERDVWAEVFRGGSELLDHPQLVHDGYVVSIIDPERGMVRQPGPLVRLSDTPAKVDRPAPRLDEQGPELRALAETAPAIACPSDGSPPRPVPGRRPPLEGVTVLELGIWLAGPLGATTLTDLGARVIKVEPLEGDPIRSVLPFPESGGAKVLQGKESVAVDVGSEEGRRIVHQLAKRADVVLQTFRAGVAERLGIDAATLRRINPNLVYLNAPGYGVDGPCGDRPAFAPTIGAGSGLALRNLGSSVTTGAELTLEEVKDYSVRLATVNYSAFASSDGLAALGVATALLLGLVVRSRGGGAQEMTTTMLTTVAHVLADDMVEYPGRPPAPMADSDLYGFNALYRIYEAARGWVVLAAPQAREWDALVGTVPEFWELASDVRFATPEGRYLRQDELAEALQRIFRLRPADSWERRLTEAGIGCVTVTEQLPEQYLQGAEFGRASGLVVDVVHPTFDEMPRLAPHVTFSRALVTPRAGCLLGHDTDRVLTELGYSDSGIADLRRHGVIG